MFEFGTDHPNRDRMGAEPLVSRASLFRLLTRAIQIPQQYILNDFGYIYCKAANEKIKAVFFAVYSGFVLS